MVMYFILFPFTKESDYFWQSVTISFLLIGMAISILLGLLYLFSINFKIFNIIINSFDFWFKIYNLIILLISQYFVLISNSSYRYNSSNGIHNPNTRGILYALFLGFLSLFGCVYDAIFISFRVKLLTITFVATVFTFNLIWVLLLTDENDNILFGIHF